MATNLSRHGPSGGLIYADEMLALRHRMCPLSDRTRPHPPLVTGAGSDARLQYLSVLLNAIIYNKRRKCFEAHWNSVFNLRVMFSSTQVLRGAQRVAILRPQLPSASWVILLSAWDFASFGGADGPAY